MIDPELIPLVAQRFKALGEPARLTLLAALQQGEKQRVRAGRAETGRSQPNVSQHLKEMARAGLVEPRREGSRVFYRIADPYVNRICDAVCRSVRAGRFPRRASRPGRGARGAGRRARPPRAPRRRPARRAEGDRG